MTRNLYLFVGRSGTGKTTIVNALCETHSWKAVESYTDRAPRYEGERGHIFVSPAEFNALPEKVACAAFAGYHYCTTTAVLDESDCFVVEPKGVCELLDRYKTRPIVVIGIYAPMRSITERMCKRGDSEDAIKVRLDMDEIAFGMMDELCDAVFVNRDLDTTVRDIDRYIAAKEADAAEHDFRTRFPDGAGKRYRDAMFLSFNEMERACAQWTQEHDDCALEAKFDYDELDWCIDLQRMEPTRYSAALYKVFRAYFAQYDGTHGFDHEKAWDGLTRYFHTTLPRMMSAQLLYDGGLLPFVPDYTVAVCGGVWFCKET